MPFKLATWNINSVRARQERLRLWLEREQPDVLCLQETKVVDDDFPHDVVESVGYKATVHGQKTYNGVALITREEPKSVVRGLIDGDDQARLIRGEVNGVLVISAYFPNGRSIELDEYQYKLDWMARLADGIDNWCTPQQSVVLTGDFNVAPNESDRAKPERWIDSVLTHETVLAALARFREWGFEDVFEKYHAEGGVYTWWDYRMLAFPKNDGLRIDHVYATPSLAAKSLTARVDRDERKKGTVEKPSDHAPVIAEFDL